MKRQGPLAPANSTRYLLALPALNPIAAVLFHGDANVGATVSIIIRAGHEMDALGRAESQTVETEVELRRVSLAGVDLGVAQPVVANFDGPIVVGMTDKDFLGRCGLRQADGKNCEANQCCLGVDIHRKHSCVKLVVDQDRSMQGDLNSEVVLRCVVEHRIKAGEDRRVPHDTVADRQSQSQSG